MKTKLYKIINVNLLIIITSFSLFAMDKEEFSADLTTSAAIVAPLIRNVASSTKFYDEILHSPEQIGQMGTCYLFGIGVSAERSKHSKNIGNAVLLYGLAAMKGDKRAQYNLGVCYENGIGINKNIHKAVYWYQLANKQEYVLAHYKLGVCYATGYGVEKSMDEAVRLYQLANKQEYVPSQHNLGICYLMGTGVPRDMNEAFRLFRLAAEKGYAPSQHNLGLWYFTQGNIKEALRWISLAAAQGNKEAIKFLFLPR